MRRAPHRHAAVWTLRRIFLLLVVFGGAAAASGCGSGRQAAAPGDGPPPNLTVLRSVVADLGRSVVDSALRATGDTVNLDVDSSEASWIARAELASALGAAGIRVAVGAPPTGSPRARWTVRGLTLGVEYRNIRKDGLFSEAVVDRIVTATFTSEIISGGSVVFAGTTTGSATDTVGENRIPGLESGSAQFTRGDVPDLRSLDRFIEPFVIIGATGAAILLFFQVRS